MHAAGDPSLRRVRSINAHMFKYNMGASYFEVRFLIRRSYVNDIKSERRSLHAAIATSWTRYAFWQAVGQERILLQSSHSRVMMLELARAMSFVFSAHPCRAGICGYVYLVGVADACICVGPLKL